MPLLEPLLAQQQAASRESGTPCYSLLASEKIKSSPNKPAAPRLRAARAGKRSPTCTPPSVRAATAPAPPSRPHHSAAMQVKPPAEQVPPDLLEQLLGACRPTCCPIQQVHPVESGTTCWNLLTGQKINTVQTSITATSAPGTRHSARGTLYAARRRPPPLKSTSIGSRPSYCSCARKERRIIRNWIRLNGSTTGISRNALV